MSEHFYEPRLGHGLPHDPFNASVGPRPIGWISSRDAQGRLNLAPYSFFNAFNYVPPIVGFASIGAKDTLRNIEETGEFVCNLATRDLAEEVGFKLAAASEVNANRNDTTDHPEGVWTLPPSFALGDVDRAKYAAIGESDRMTLLFRKRK